MVNKSFFKKINMKSHCINVFKLILFSNFCHEEEIKHFPVIITSIKNRGKLHP